MRVALGAVFLLTVICYRPIWSAGWVYEDANAVMANPSVIGTAPIAVNRARWISALSHRLVYAVTKGPRLPHVVNLGLHLLNGGLVYAIALVLLSPVAAWLATALFLLHPLQTEAVMYVASRSELLSTCFALVAFWLALDARRWFHHVAVWLCVCLAIGAKESAVVIVPLMAVVALFRNRPWSIWRTAALLLPVAIMASSVLTFDYTSQSELTPLDYAATQAAALWRYLAIVVLPIGQSVDHDYDIVAFGWRYLALIGVWALALVPIFGGLSMVDGDTGRIGRLWGTSTMRDVAFGVAWLLIALAPRFVMRVPEILNEHQFYLPMVGVTFALSAVIGPHLGGFYAATTCYATTSDDHR